MNKRLKDLNVCVEPRESTYKIEQIRLGCSSLKEDANDYTETILCLVNEIIKLKNLPAKNIADQITIPVNELKVCNEKLYIETLSQFHSNPEDENIGTQTWEKYCFEITAIDEFNEGSDHYTTIGLKNGNRYTVAILYEEFKKLISEIGTIKKSINDKALYEYKEQED
jgi:hypothetical protein